MTADDLRQKRNKHLELANKNIYEASVLPGFIEIAKFHALMAQTYQMMVAHHERTR